MKTDAQIRDDVETELRWDPSVDGTIGVIVHDGVVTLTGEAKHYAGRWAAEDATKRVKGVRAIANEIQVKMPVAGMRSDTDIAEAAANALRWNVTTETANIKRSSRMDTSRSAGRCNGAFNGLRPKMRFVT